MCPPDSPQGCCASCPQPGLVRCREHRVRTLPFILSHLLQVLLGYLFQTLFFHALFPLTLLRFDNATDYDDEENSTNDDKGRIYDRREPI